MIGSNQAKIAISIVNFRTEQLTIECLESLAPERTMLPNLSVWVCDNGSGADAVPRLEAAVEDSAWRDWVRIISSATNRGFAAGNNLVLREILRDEDVEFVMLLNSDTVVQHGAIARLVETMTSTTDLGVLSAQMTWPDGTPQTVEFTDINPTAEFLRAANVGRLSRLFGRQAAPLAVVPGRNRRTWLALAGVLIRRSALDQIGLLDEGYFMYFEDLEFSRRVSDAGWALGVCDSARIVHFIGGSSHIQDAVDRGERRPRFYYESRSRYLSSRVGPAGLWAANIAWHLGRCVSLPRERVGGSPSHLCRSEWIDIWANWRDPAGDTGPAASEPRLASQ